MGATGATAPPSGRAARGCRRRRACGAEPVSLACVGSTGVAVARENWHGRRGGHEYRGARLARHAFAVLSRADGSETARLDEIAARQRKADEKRKEETGRREQAAEVCQISGGSVITGRQPRDCGPERSAPPSPLALARRSSPRRQARVADFADARIVATAAPQLPGCVNQDLAGGQLLPTPFTYVRNRERSSGVGTMQASRLPNQP